VFVLPILLILIGFEGSWIWLIIAGFIYLISAIIRFFTTLLLFTNKRMAGKVGLFKTGRMDTPLDKINNVAVYSGLSGKIFNYGKINVITSSRYYNFTTIAKPGIFQSELMRQIDLFKEEQRNEQAAAISRATKSDDMLNTMEQMATQMAAEMAKAMRSIASQD
jgi:uncharacterized membrane protein YdbT with pleckstrin-like domain